MLIKTESRFYEELYINLSFIVIAAKIQTSLDEEYYRLTLLNGNCVDITPKAWEHIRDACVGTIALMEDPINELKESEE